MGQSESRQRSPPEHQQPQEKRRRRLRNSIHVLIPRRRHSSAIPEPTNNERHASRRWSRAFCRPSPSPSLTDAPENKQSAVYEDAAEKGDANADADSDSDTEEALVLAPLDDSGHETPHLHVTQQQAEGPDSESQVRRVDEDVTPDGSAEEGENSDKNSAVEDVRVCAPLDDLDEETLTPVLHASEMPLPAPAPHAQVDDLEALDKDAGEGADPVIDSDVIDDGDNDGDAEEGGEAAADSRVEYVLVSVPLDNLDEETPNPMTHGAETQVPVPPPQAQADEPDVADGDAEKGGGADAVADSGSNPEDVRLRPPLDDIDNESPPILPAQVPQGDKEEASYGDAEDGGVADMDSASDVVEDRAAEKGGDPDADSRMEDVRVLTPPDDMDDTIQPILHVQPQPQVIEEAPDRHAIDGVDAEEDADADSGAENMRVRVPLEHFDEDVATPALHAQVPQVEHDEQWIVHTTDIPSPSTLPVGVTDTSGASNTLTTPPPVRVPATSDRQFDFPRAQAMPTSLIASSFARATVASASPSSISPANASPSSSAGTLPQTPPPTLGNIRQAVSASARRAPSPVRQSPSTPTPSRTYPPLGGGSQAGPSPNSRTGDKCYLLAPSTQLRRKEGHSLLRAGHAVQSGTTPLTGHVPEGGKAFAQLSDSPTSSYEAKFIPTFHYLEFTKLIYCICGLSCNSPGLRKARN
ncbi:hypothetical protein B0H13DRAFT_2276850 [Mycena leptocephala]|nr:hypothetical protein B0H13DRAFT_2276850 [Mycena leptocephala]